jgi:arginine-tRNA-protein transferase
MQHRIDGQLFAVGVLDILPTGASSVYLLYDPAFGDLKPGIITAIKEIEFVKAEMAAAPEFQYYYMGFYIPNCQKMRYKGEYRPSELL